MKNKFIRLHNTNDNSVVIVNIDAIRVIDTKIDKGKTTSMIYTDTSTNMDEFSVNESPEKIYTMLDEIYKE